MRLDHLLSTEFFEDAGPASVVWPACRGSSPVWRGRAGVEEIVGFAGSLGAGGEWCGYAFGFPDRHPRLGRVRFSGCPWRDAVGLAGRGSGPVGARGGLRTG